ncbi:hypothetical protein EYC84_005917 [Monilinia fructicola]|uniref:RNA ligase domain-containing protein n=1 Tax=Monilinia fructicola TaxID=38448 RepID=A0A5M9K6M9_MONFR|nr:hypothetical protein EYC84_005917 [Monilinia fructicola]
MDRDALSPEVVTEHDAPQVVTDHDAPQVVTDHDAQSPQLAINHDAQSPQVVTYHDTRSPQVVSDYDIKRKGLAQQDSREKPSIAFNNSDYDPTLSPSTPGLRKKGSMAFNSDYDPALAPAPLNPYPRDSDSASIAPTYRSTPSFPVDKFTISTRTDSLASGFPFHQRLYDFRVTHDEWHLFTGAIVQAASLTLQEDWAAWTAGISTGVLSTGLLVLDKVKEGLMHEGKIRATLHEWNDKTWLHKGFKAWLELPSMKGEFNGEEVDPQTMRNMSKKEKKAKEKEQSRFKILIIPTAVPAGPEIGMSRIMGDNKSTWSLPDTPSEQRTNMASTGKTLYPKISGKPKNLLLEFSKFQNKSKGRRATTISVTGTVKLHGTHTDFLIHADNTIQLQSRNNEHLTADKDTIGFVPFAMVVQRQILGLKKNIHDRFLKLNPKAKLNDEHPLIIAGEFIGPKIQKDVAISALPDKCFVIISISINNEWQPDEQYADIHNEPCGIFNVSRGGFLHEMIVLKNPDLAFAKMQALSNAVEEECPFAKSFGIIGLGEGIVWKPAAPLCYDAKYWLKLKGPISMGTAVAGPARIPERSGFVTPVFSNPKFSLSPTSKAVASRPLGTVIPHRSGFVAPVFSASTPAAAESRSVPDQRISSTVQLQSPASRQSPPASNSTPLTTKVAVWNSDNTKPTQGLSVAQEPRKVDESSSAISIQGRRPALIPKKVDAGRLQNLKNVEKGRPMLFDTTKVELVTEEKSKPIANTKLTPLTPEMIQQAKSEILNLIHSRSPKISPPVFQRVDRVATENLKPTKSVKTAPGISEGVDCRFSENEHQEQGKLSIPSFSQKDENTEPANTKLGPSYHHLRKFSQLEKPIRLSLIFMRSQEPGASVAKAFANKVVRGRRLEQGWQYLLEMGVPTDMKGVEAFLQWLWHDVAVEEKSEIEEFEIDKGLLKKEIHKIGRDWYFEELAFEEQRENFGVGAPIGES